jgi:hypothetical protein
MSGYTVKTRKLISAEGVRIRVTEQLDGKISIKDVTDHTSTGLDIILNKGEARELSEVLSLFFTEYKGNVYT